MRILVDTNILLRAIQNESPLCAVARKALKTLHRQNRQLCLTRQNVREFWNVCTRPTDHNGLGISVCGTERHARFLERYFTVLTDSALPATRESLRLIHGPSDFITRFPTPRGAQRVFNKKPSIRVPIKRGIPKCFNGYGELLVFVRPLNEEDRRWGGPLA